MSTNPKLPTLIIGAGQAGLAVGHALRQRGIEPLILERDKQLGASWRNRWDSLRLFTPAAHDGLPGLPFPAPEDSFPTKDQMAEYLESYASHCGLDVRTGVEVTAARHDGDKWVIMTASGETRASRLIVATGTNSVPAIPAIAADLDPRIDQLHSSEYRNPAQIASGDVLVVGAGTSGADIALELAATHRVFIAGRPTVHIPDFALEHFGALYWRFINSVLTRKTPIGRRAARGFENRGAPLIRVSMPQLERAGVTLLPRVEGVTDGSPTLTDGRTILVRTIIWATGYRASLDWITTLPGTEGGWPDHARGIVAEQPELYFLGIPFQFALTSTLIGGVGRDAEFIADHISRPDS